jgi:HlyD family secretion protein
MSPSPDPENYQICGVDRGPVVLSVPASGIVNPENEVLLLSPSFSVVSSIHHTPGSQVKKGDIIMTLDPKTLTREIDNLRDQLGVMENDLQKNRLNSRSIRVDLDYNAEVKNLRINSLKTEIADQEQLLKVGGISPALHEQTKQELLLAEKDLKMIKEKNSIRLRQLEAEERGLQLQTDIKQKELEAKVSILNRLDIRAPSDGIILGVYANVGEQVETNKLLVKMSDLSTYKIMGSAENKYLENLKTGGEVYTILENVRLKGTIGNVSPVINNKMVSFDVFLDTSHFRQLFPNLEVELMIVTQRRDSVLRIEQGPAFNRSRHQDVYVIGDGKAVRTTITTGLIGTDYIEVESGLYPGDRVVVSDVSPFRHRKEVDFEEL